MKKALSMIMVFILLFSCGIISTSAESSKLTPDLEEVIDASNPTDIIRIYIWLNGFEKTYHDMTIDEYDKYIDPLYVEIMPEIFKNMSHFLAINTSLTEFNYIVVEVKVQDIEKLAAQEIVTKIDYARHKYTPVECTIDDKVQELIDTSDPDEMIPIQLWFSDHMLRKDDMPSWSDKDKATEEYSRYCSARDSYLAKNILKDAEGVRFRCMGGGFWIIDARAKDIPGIAASGFVKEIYYHDDSIIDSPAIDGDKIDPKVIGYLHCDVTEQTVFIELDLESKVPKEMPSWPDYNKATREYEEYYWNNQKEFERIVEELKSSTHMQNVRGVCHEAVIAMVGNDPTSISELAMNEHVKYIRCFDLYDKNYDENNTRNRYRDRLLRQYPTHDTYTGDPLILYQEVYYHAYTGDDKTYGTDWAIVQASISGIVACAELEQIVGGRLLYAPNTFQRPFAFDIGVYDAQQDKFFDITEVDFDDYPDLYEVWQRMDIGELTVKEQPGDADGDNDVTILDATKIQRGVVGLDSRNEIVATGADADGDGEMTVLDATRIQRYKAELCNLDGTEYKKA